MKQTEYTLKQPPNCPTNRDHLYAPYNIYRRLGVIFNNELAENIIDSIISVNSLEIYYHSNNRPNTYIFRSPNLKAMGCLDIANSLVESSYAFESCVDAIYRISLNSAPNDYYYEDDQYYLQPEYTDFETAYDYVLTDSIVEIALFDTGIEPHEDFDDSLIIGGYNYIGQWGPDYGLPVVCNANDTHPSAHYHGNAVTSLIAATINNELDIAGTSNSVRIRMQKIIDCVHSSAEFDIWVAMTRAVDSGALILNNSWTSNSEFPVTGFVNVAIDSADSRGVLVIFSAGNCYSQSQVPCGNFVPYPANHPLVFTVGATNKFNTRWEHSAYDSDSFKVDVCAPGFQMITLDQMGADTGYHKSPISIPCADNYNVACYLDGTSFAAPLVSGLAARILARRPEFIGNPDTLKHIIKHSTGNGWHNPMYEDTIVVTKTLGYGRINAARAMLAVSRGDATNDAILNGSDIYYLIDYVYDNGPDPLPDFRVGDVDCSGIVNLSDILDLISYLYVDPPGPPPKTCFKY